MLLFLLILVILVLGIFLFVNSEPFGQLATGERKERIKKSPNYRDRKFQNLNYTPDLTEGVSYVSVLNEFLFKKKHRPKPSIPIPSEKTILHSLNSDEQVIIWMGHSSYFIQADGKKMLVDPVFSGSASPISFTTTAFQGTDRYSVDDIPVIDYLFISHDHWDHLDYQTIKSLREKVGKVITGLGTGAHFERWGYSAQQLLECDWYDTIQLDHGFGVTILPARHFSGRGLKRNQSLWVSFALKTPSFKLYLGGDSGYDTHFAAIGEQYGPFDLAILECGQYDKSWKYIHMLPHEILPAAKALNAKKLLPVHWGKFQLGNHAWDEPIIKLLEQQQDDEISILTPMIGQKIYLKEVYELRKWWELIP